MFSSHKILLNLSYFIVVIGFFACSPKTKVVVDKPAYEKVVHAYKPQLSQIDIPIKLSVADIQSKLNKELEGVIYEDNSFSNNGNDNLKVVVTKIGLFEIDVKGNLLTYTLPLRFDVTMRQPTMFGDIIKSTKVEARVKFETEYNIKNDWSLNVKTNLKEKEILNSPSIELGIIKIPLKGVITNMLSLNDKTICGLIDDNIKEVLPTRARFEKMWLDVQEPILIDEDYKAWLTLVPINVRMSPIYAEHGYVDLTLGLDAYVDIKIGDKPKVIPRKQLPDIQRGTKKDSLFHVALETEINYSQASQVLRNNFVGYKYNYSKKKYVEVSDLTIYGNGDKIVVAVDIRGNIEGQVYLTGIPRYDPVTTEIYIDEFEFDTHSKNALLKSAEKLVNGPFKKTMQKQMRFSIADELKETQKMINESLNENRIDENTVVKCEVTQVVPTKILLSETGMDILFQIDGMSSVLYGSKR